MPITTGDNKFGVAKWIVDPTAGQGTHTTIASALTSASSGDTIFIRPGTYTENLTLKAGVNLTAFSSDGTIPNVKIVGKCSASFSGACTISGVQLQTNSDYLLAVTGSSPTVVYVRSCYLNVSNNNGINYTSSDSSSSLEFSFCETILNTSYTSFISTSAGSLSFRSCRMNRSSVSNVVSTWQTGSLFVQNSTFCHPIQGTSSTSSMNVAEIICNNTTCLTLVTSGKMTLQNVYLESGTASAISAGAGTEIRMMECSINTSNTNGVTGSGSCYYAPTSWKNSGQILNTSTIVNNQFGYSGTYTPELTFGGGNTGITYNTRFGKYWVIGKLVYGNIYVQLSNKGSSSGVAKISLPFTPASDGCYYCFSFYSENITYASNGSVIFSIDPGNSLLNVLLQVSSTVNGLSNTNFSNTSIFQGSFFYWVD